MENRKEQNMQGFAEDNSNTSGPTDINKPAVVTIDPRIFTTRLLYIAVFLFLLNLLSILLAEVYLQDHFITNTLVYFFDARLEANIPTLFSTLIILLTSGLLYMIYHVVSRQKDQKNKKNYWLVLCMMFIFLGIDEAAVLHENFNKLRPLIGDNSGYLYYTWIIPYAFFVLIAGLFFIRFLLGLPEKTRRLSFIAGSVYVFSALGFEVFESRVTTLYGAGHMYDKLLCAVEEFLEMCGIILYIYALLDYLSQIAPQLKMVALGSKGSERP
jgi:hypothetical protein